MRLKATSARLAALSISSRRSRMTSGLGRTSTPTAPMLKMIAETARYQPMAISGPLPAALVAVALVRAGNTERLCLLVGLGVGGGAGAQPGGLGHRPAERRAGRVELRSNLVLGEAAATAGENDGADRGDEQQQRGELERE